MQRGTQPGVTAPPRCKRNRAFHRASEASSWVCRCDYLGGLRGLFPRSALAPTFDEGAATAIEKVPGAQSRSNPVRLTGKRRPIETVRRIPFVLGRDCEILKTKGTVGKLGSSATRCIERNSKSRARFFLPATGAGQEPPWQSRASFSRSARQIDASDSALDAP